MSSGDRTGKIIVLRRPGGLSSKPDLPERQRETDPTIVSPTDFVLSVYVMTSRDERCMEASELSRYRLLCTMNGRCAVWWHGCFYALVRRHRDLNVNPAIEQDTKERTCIIRTIHIFRA